MKDRGSTSVKEVTSRSTSYVSFTYVSFTYVSFCSQFYQFIGHSAVKKIAESIEAIEATTSRAPATALLPNLSKASDNFQLPWSLEEETL